MKEPQKLNVLYLSNNPERQSTTAPTEGWIKNLRMKGLSPVIIIPKMGSLYRWALLEKIPIYILDLEHPDKSSPISSLFQVLKISKVIFKHRVNLIHCNEQNVFPLGSLVSRIHSIPTVVSIHFSMSKEFCKWAFTRHSTLRRVLFVSEANQEMCIENLNSIVDNKYLMVLKNGIDLDYYAYNEELRIKYLTSLNLGNQFIIGVACALRPRKQVEHLIEAALLIDSDNLVVLIAGSYLPEDIEYGENLINNAKEKLGDRIKFLGHLDELVGFYSALDLFVNTSQEEACSLSVLQAMSCSCPVVGYSSKDTVSEQILPGGGEIVPQDDIVALSKVIRKFMDDNELRLEARKGARKRVVDEYDIRRQSELLLDQYNEIIVNY